MFKENIESIRNQRTARRIKNLAPTVLVAGYAQTFNNGYGVFWLPELARGRDKLTSGSTQPWLLVGAAGLLEEKGQLERSEATFDTGDPWKDAMQPYAITELGKLTCARLCSDGQPIVNIPAAMTNEMAAFKLGLIAFQ